MSMGSANPFQDELESWLHGIIKREKPVEEISAFRFGLGEAEEGYVLYLAGSKNYDEADDDWASYPPEFLVEEELIIAVAEEQEWHWVLLQVIYSLGRVLRKSPVNSSFLGNDRPVYAGFEDGDLYRIK
ncbi:hypothetical protein [Hymenobacter coccineus]|uniref:hypothetical protein n=1 Tax=Hymenobacter coccineus TaxID=1908235 RepID=UPI000F79EC4B|nr:hypothetical protein [Hymenobacter coccineus]